MSRRPHELTKSKLHLPRALHLHPFTARWTPSRSACGGLCGAALSEQVTSTPHGGRYALLQGGLSARGSPNPVAPREDNPVVRRGMVAWAGGASGPAFFVALADHPEWGRGHTVFADVVAEDMRVVERIVREPTRTTPGKIPITNLLSPVKITLEKL